MRIQSWVIGDCYNTVLMLWYRVFVVVEMAGTDCWVNIVRTPNRAIYLYYKLNIAGPIEWLFDAVGFYDSLYDSCCCCCGLYVVCTASKLLPPAYCQFKTITGAQGFGTRTVCITVMSLIGSSVLQCVVTDLMTIVTNCSFLMVVVIDDSSVQFSINCYTRDSTHAVVAIPYEVQFVLMNSYYRGVDSLLNCCLMWQYQPPELDSIFSHTLPSSISLLNLVSSRSVSSNTTWMCDELRCHHNHWWCTQTLIVTTERTIEESLLFFDSTLLGEETSNKEINDHHCCDNKESVSKSMESIRYFICCVVSTFNAGTKELSESRKETRCYRKQ